MRHAKLYPYLLIAASWVAGCSGLNDYHHHGGGTTPPTGSITVTPAVSTVTAFGTQTFTATQGGSATSAVTWQVNGVTGGSQTTGYITTSGQYVAPGGVPTSSSGSGNSSTTTVTITAVAKSSSNIFGTATVTVSAPNQNTQSGAIELGTSGGNINDTSGGYCCGGTLGSLVVRNGTYYILSNNHVLAKRDSGVTGDPISQPGTIDATTTCSTVGTKTVANLSEFFNLETGALPKVDAALAQIASGQVDTSGNILLLGATQSNGTPAPGAPHAGTGVAATVGQAVAKSGRTTALTCSTVLATNVMGSVGYPRNCGDTAFAFTVNYTDLVSVTGGSFSAEGDSGSLIVTQSTADPVALLFAGSDTDTVGNTVSDVLAAFPGAGNATPTFVGGAAHQVIGCTLPTQPQSATAPQAQVATEILQAAGMVRDTNGPGLIGNNAIYAVGVGPSYDHPGQAAIVLFVNSANAPAAVPQTVQGVGTRVVAGEGWKYRGVLSSQETTEMLQGAAAPQIVYTLRTGEMERAKVVHAAHAAELLKNPSVVGVGITSSVDSPGEAALLIYVKKGTAQESFPVQIDGLRTRLRETGPFVAGRGSNSGKASSGCRVPGVAKMTRDSGKL